jgi:uncharacterized protein
MSLRRPASLLIPILGIALVLLCVSAPLAVADTTIERGDPAAPEADAAASDTPWWVWPIVLFVFCFVLGIVAVVAGIGGGVLFVPLVAGFFPFHIDFVRTTGLLMALSGALAAGPGLLKRRLANLRLVLPCAVFASIGSLVGANVGLAMEASVVQTSLGVCILGIVVLLSLSRSAERPRVLQPDRLSSWLGIGGRYVDASDGEAVHWQVHRMPLALLLFVGVGFLAGMFGLGAGWANVPVLTMVLGVPVKLAVGSSVFMLSITDTTAAWVYLKNGCWMPLMALPSIFGLMLGTQIGVRVLGRSRPKMVRYVVIAVMVVAGLRSLLRGTGVW